MERASPGRVVATKTHNHWKSGHLSGTPQIDPLRRQALPRRGCRRSGRTGAGTRKTGQVA
ncbi:hypothetical protein ppKF707_4277 [Metapseudomonas furukawaii]|uniref:Uncharacterized protein n=1 Tax=Metapseudomonas furukawaii TaxID=1149133 RepID=A0AAD1FHW5_METFU|nr:hypothetical protein ppKF707_4277 [Pseudomonas furukawaii]BAU77096.1 hypothetical protein KF707C_54080 [Pseudomonas furukawaii]